MKGITYSFIALLLIASFASAQEVAHLRGTAVDGVSEQPRNLADEPVVTPTEAPVLDCKKPYYNNGAACALCMGGIISDIAGSTTQECTPCVAPNYISFNECVAECSCAEVDGWTKTYCGYYAFKTCGEGFIGNSRRLCSNNVFQDEDRSGCISTESIVEKSGAGMIDIPITFDAFPPYVDNSEIPLYVSKAALQQYPYQLNNLQVTMENPYDTNEGANDKQIAHLMIGSNSIYGKNILSTTEDSITGITGSLYNMNSEIFSKDVMQNVSAPTDVAEITNVIEDGVCTIEEAGCTYDLTVGQTDDMVTGEHDCATLGENYVSNVQCVQDLLTVSPYILKSHNAYDNGDFRYMFLFDSNKPVDFVKSDFFKKIYGFMMSNIHFPKTAFNIDYVISLYDSSSEVYNTVFSIYFDLIYTGKQDYEVTGEIDATFASIEFQNELQAISGVTFIEDSYYVSQ